MIYGGLSREIVCFCHCFMMLWSEACHCLDPHPGVTMPRWRWCCRVEWSVYSGVQLPHVPHNQHVSEFLADLWVPFVHSRFFVFFWFENPLTYCSRHASCHWALSVTSPLWLTFSVSLSFPLVFHPLFFFAPRPVLFAPLPIFLIPLPF